MINPTDYQGMVEGPGKFEGQLRAAEYYWELAMDGQGDDLFFAADETLFTLLQVNDEEGKAFEKDGILAGDTVVIFEDSLGFVYMRVFKSREEALAYVKRW